MQQSKKKKRSRGSKKGKAKSPAASGEISNTKVENDLTEAFASVSLEKAASAYKEDNGDPNRAAEILANVGDSSVSEDQSTSCSSSSANYVMDTNSSSGGNYNETSSCSSASEFFVQANDCFQEGFKPNSKIRSKKVVATAGTVGTILGKDYVRSTPNKSSLRWKKFEERSWSREDKEQLLCSMLGSESELSLAVIRDVLCQCGNEFEKALDVLFELSASSTKQPKCYDYSAIREDAQFLLESNDSSLSDGTLNSTYIPKIDVQDNIWSTRSLYRNILKGSAANGSHCLKETRHLESELPQEVLKSLFNMPTPKNAEHEPSTMNWRNVVRKMASLGQTLQPVDGEKEQCLQAEGDEYQVFRLTAKQHWDTKTSYYQKAATAFANGEREYASYLSDQGRLHNKMAQEADEKASQDIFNARNKNIENIITIDLHGQHIKQAMRLLKLHLFFGACVRSVQLFRVITGCGRHGVGRSKLKNSVIGLLQKECITWSEENSGTLIIRLDGQSNFKFLDCDSDSE